MFTHEDLMPVKGWKMVIAPSITFPEPTPVHYDNLMKVSSLLKEIGKKHEWSEEQIANDLEILHKHRLFYTRDLRALSDHSWETIELLPIVRDILRTSVDPNWKENQDPEAKEKREQERREKKERKKEKKREKKEREEQEREQEEYRYQSFGQSVHPFDMTSLRAQYGFDYYNRKPQIPVVSREELGLDAETIRNTVRNESIEIDPSELEKVLTSSSDDSKRRKSVTFPDDLDLLLEAHKEERRKEKKKRAKKELKKSRKEACRRATIETVKRLERAERERQEQEEKEAKKKNESCTPTPENDLVPVKSQTSQLVPAN